MARVTIERTLDKVGSRFELVVLTAYRAHAIYCGSQTFVNTNDKYAVLALREVESGKLDMKKLRDVVIEKYALENTQTTTAHSFVSNDFAFDNAKESQYLLDKGENSARTIKRNSMTVGDDLEINGVRVKKDFFA